MCSDTVIALLSIFVILSILSVSYTHLDYEDGCLPIRIPGGTLGTIEYDENKIITKIHVRCV